MLFRLVFNPIQNEGGQKTPTSFFPVTSKNVGIRPQELLEELEIMYQKAIYICISRYNKICWFPMKKC